MFQPIEEMYDRIQMDVPKHDYLLLPSGGSTIEECVDQAIDMADLTASTILLVFNGYPLMILPGSDRSEQLAFYEDMIPDIGAPDAREEAANQDNANS